MQNQVLDIDARSKGVVDLRLLWRLLGGKLRDRGTYIVAAVVGPGGLEPGTRIYFAAEDAEYIVTHAPTANGEFNVYLTRLPHVG